MIFSNENKPKLSNSRDDSEAMSGLHEWTSLSLPLSCWSQGGFTDSKQYNFIEQYSSRNKGAAGEESCFHTLRENVSPKDLRFPYVISERHMFFPLDTINGK